VNNHPQSDLGSLFSVLCSLFSDRKRKRKRKRKKKRKRISSG